jgi:hypothetical protein
LRQSSTHFVKGAGLPPNLVSYDALNPLAQSNSPAARYFMMN